MQAKNSLASLNSEQWELKIHKAKLKVNYIITNITSLCTKMLEVVSSFNYIGSLVDKRGGIDADIKVFCNIKIRIFKTNMKSVRLYG